MASTWPTVSLLITFELSPLPYLTVENQMLLEEGICTCIMLRFHMFSCVQTRIQKGKCIYVLECS